MNYDEMEDYWDKYGDYDFGASFQRISNKTKAMRNEREYTYKQKTKQNRERREAKQFKQEQQEEIEDIYAEDDGE